MIEELQTLTNETRLLFHQLVASGERLHDREPVSIAMRAVLEYLHENGDATVPAIARDRGVSRQHIQTLVNALVEQGAVVPKDNPAHRRSALIALTRVGRQIIQRMKKREAQFLGQLELPITTAEVIRATATLQALRETLEEAL